MPQCAPFVCTVTVTAFSLFPCGASSRNGQGQPSEMRVRGCAACSGVQISILKLRFVRGPMPWVSAPSARPQLSDSWQLSTKSVHLCNQAKPMRSPENTECPRAPRTADTRSRPAGAVIPSGGKIICTAAKTSQ